MAIMIPDQIPDGAPQSEKIIFESLKRAPQARDWVVFYSEYVDNPDDSTRPREIDFLILTDNFSVICLEAKGGSYTVRGKEWYRLPDGGRIGSPTRQARESMFALKNEFSTRFNSSSLLSLGCAVAFTDSQFPSDARIPKEALIVESTDARDPNNLGKKLADYADNLPKDEVKTLLKDPKKSVEALEAKDALRSELETTVTITTDPTKILHTDLETLRLQLLRLTDDQMIVLDLINNNDRCIINGAAGTGKTVLALELARQLCEEKGKTVALLCSNPNLRARFDGWTNMLTTDNGGKVVAGTPATLPFWAFGTDATLKNRHCQRLTEAPNLEESLKRGYHLDDKWYSFIDETVKDLGMCGVFDYLIVDEAQNLCDEIFLKLMNALLKGGLAKGHWTMFGDFTNQNIVASRLTKDFSKDLPWTDIIKKALEDFSEDLAWTNHELKTNCRNTYEIATTTAKLVGIESPPMSGVHGPLVQIKYFNSPKDSETMLSELISGWRDNGFTSEQIILLSSDIGSKFISQRSCQKWKLLNISTVIEKRLRSNKKEDVLDTSVHSLGKTLRYSDIYDFQGLESELAILIIPQTEDQVELADSLTVPQEKHLNRVLYTGMSRAKAMLVIVADELWREILERREFLHDKLTELQQAK